MKNKLLLLLIYIFISNSPIFAQSQFAFENYNEIDEPLFNGDNFQTATVGKDGKIFVGSRYHGIVKFDPFFGTWSTSLDDRHVFISELQKGNGDDLWVGNAGQLGNVSGGSSIGGGIRRYGVSLGFSIDFYTITAPGRLASRNVRGIWVDKNNTGPNGKYRVWVAQGTYFSSGQSTAGGISVGVNVANDYVFTKIYRGLQVTPNVPANQAGKPNCLSVGGNATEVWVGVQLNFGRSQILRYRADDPNTFLGYYDYTNTPELSTGFRANAIFFDTQNRGWLGLIEGGLRIKTLEGWKIMNDPSVLPVGTIINPNAITQDERGFIYFGTSKGVLIYKGGPVDNAAAYEMVNTTKGLIFDDIQDVAADTVNNRIILAHQAGITFMKFRTKLKSTLEWDHSFPKNDTKPIGVAADGVSRLFLKIRRDDSGDKAIKKVSVSIHGIAQQLSSVAGKLKKAVEFNQYSNEANTGAGMVAERTDSTANGDFYFWYVAPEDFSADSLGIFSQKQERIDSIKIKATYDDDSEDSSYMEIKVVRPPLLMTSMLSNAKKILESVQGPSEPAPIMNSNKFFSKTALAMNQLSSLAENAARIIDGDKAQNGDGSNSFQGILENVRKIGIAASRVDVVANDIAGVAVRAAQALKPDKFYADGDYAYNNYGKGFINKFISVNVPHNGSTFYQMLQDFGPTLSEVAKKTIAAIEEKSNDAEPYQFLQMEAGELKLMSEILSKSLTDAGSFKLPETTVKNHLIATELTSTGAAPGGLGMVSAPIRKLLDQLTLTIRDNSPELKPQMGALLGAEIGSEARIMGMFNNYSNMKGVQNFATIGDMISNISSQLAGALENSPHVTKQVYTVNQNAFSHVSTLGASAKKIINLLNTSINSPSFASTIPANNVSTALTNIGHKIGKLLYDTAKIVITNRAEINNASSNFKLNDGIIDQASANDTTIVLKYTVKDTVQLQYVFINYQDTMYTSTAKTRNQQLTLRIKKTMLLSGSQELTAVAVYENADSIKYHADTLNSWVIKPTVQDFRITEQTANLFDGIAYKPSYQVKVDEIWQPLPNNDPEINITIEQPTKLEYDNMSYKFNASKDGFSRVFFVYKTFKDTVEFNCLLPLKAIAINRTVSNGNFKDSTTWSKGYPPLPADSVIITTGHTIILDSTIQIRALRIDNGGTLTLNNSSLNLQLGDGEDGPFLLDNYGTLNITNGTLKVSGHVRHNTGSTFNMSGGVLIIEGNISSTRNRLKNELYLFEALAGMSNFSFIGGSLQLIDPSINVSSQAIFCPYSFGANSTLIVGNGVAVSTNNSPSGFGGNWFPPQMGNLILNASVQASNR